MAEERRGHEVAFVLGGGGVLGAHEVGMLQALAEGGVRPDLVLGTSVGALNGVFVAAHADPGAAVPELAAVWREGVAAEAFAGSLFGRVRTLARSGTHLHPNEPLRRLLEARTQLSNLLTYMDGKSNAEALIAKVLADPALLKTLAGSPKPQDPAASQGASQGGAQGASKEDTGNA